MGKIGKISSIKRQYSNEYRETLAGSLADKGYSRVPGSLVRLVPDREPNGNYITGLNPDALYIKNMARTDPDGAAQEKARVAALKDELESLTNLDLGPRSEYYSKMYDDQFRSNSRARIVKLRDGVNLFNLDDPYDHITYAWVRVHRDIAPSYQAFIEGRVKNSTNVNFFVDDEEYQNEIEYQQNAEMNKATGTLDKMSPEKQFRIARLLGLPVGQNDKPSTIYNILNTYLKTEPKKGAKGINIKMFNKFIEMSDDNLSVRFIIEEAIKYNIYRVKANRVYEGEVMVAKDKQELIENLSTVSFQEDLLALEEKVRQKKLIEAL